MYHRNLPLDALIALRDHHDEALRRLEKLIDDERQRKAVFDVEKQKNDRLAAINKEFYHRIASGESEAVIITDMTIKHCVHENYLKMLKSHTSSIDDHRSRLINELRKQGLSATEIAARLKIGRATIYRKLKNA